MIPREHGAYAELAFPILAVLIGGVPASTTWLLAVAVVACFVANEPLLILTGHRGSRALRDQRSLAQLMLFAMALVAFVTGGTAIQLAPPLVGYLALIPLCLGCLLVWLAARGFERRLVGEFTAATALSSVALPLGVTAGLSLGTALAVALIWFVASILGTSVVRLTVAGAKARTEAQAFRVRSKWALLLVAAMAMVGVAVLAGLAPRGPRWVLVATLPVSLVALAFSIAKPNVRNIRLVGWGLVFANLCTLLVVVAALWLIVDYETIRSALPFRY